MQSEAPLGPLTVCVCTYNSAGTLERCLEGIRRNLPFVRLIVVDHNSTDGTERIAARYGAEIHFESVSLGHARQLCFNMVKTDYLTFVDSDVEIEDRGFFGKALQLLEDRHCGAVVGMAVGHRFAYGLPASLLVLRKHDFEGRIIPEFIDARETFYIQRRLDARDLRTIYLPGAMIHHSGFRRYKPEWEGANTRIACGLDLLELFFAVRVILLMSLNSRNLRNVVYTPVFFLKFLRGFASPQAWRQLSRIPQ